MAGQVKEIGRGGFGITYLGQNRNSEKVAIKKVSATRIPAIGSGE